MKKLIFHIGQHKTGTTTLQSSFHASRDALLKHGVLYPRALAGYNHRLIKGYFAGPEGAENLERRKFKGDATAITRRAREAWNLIQEDIRSQQPETTILSAECFERIGTEECFPEFIREISELADEVVFVAYLRAPSSRYLSGYQQLLKTSPTKVPANMNSLFRVPLEPFFEFPQVKLEVHKFDRSTLRGGSIVADFAQRYLPACAAHDLRTPNGDENSSLSAEAMAVLEDIHTGSQPAQFSNCGPFSPKLSKRIIRLDAEFPGHSRPRYKQGIATIIHEACTDLGWLRDTFGIVFTPPEASVVPVKLPREQLSRVRAICIVDESRYRALWKLVGESFETLDGLEIQARQKVEAEGTKARSPDKRKPWRLSFMYHTTRKVFRFMTKPIRSNPLSRKLRSVLRGKLR